jgi:two-component system, chemotaxis family, sensor kinase CheA
LNDSFSREPMLELFIHEATQMIEQLEQVTLRTETTQVYDEETVNQVFRIMHTIKGSSSMMMFTNMAKLSHAVEDIFYFVREHKPDRLDTVRLTDLILEVLDLMKLDMLKIENGLSPEEELFSVYDELSGFLNRLKVENHLDTNNPEASITKPGGEKEHRYYIGHVKPEAVNTYKAVIQFEASCEMIGIRAFTSIRQLQENMHILEHEPSDLLNAPDAEERLHKEGLTIIFTTTVGLEEARELFQPVSYVENLTIEAYEPFASKDTVQTEMKLSSEAPIVPVIDKKSSLANPSSTVHGKQTMINVHVSKLDRLMDMVGELVIAEAMVTENPEIQGLSLDNFHKSARQLRKIIGELQDVVMSVRMVPISGTFQKMHRIVRDMCKKLSKEVKLEIIGEETEVDKNMIEQIGDPLMHLIRNSIDHGIEMPEERLRRGKPQSGTVVLEAKTVGSEVWIMIRDDGQGLNRDKILQRARVNGLIHKPEHELSDMEIFAYILLPGFSTKEEVTEYSGRGVGMDVALQNIHQLGGTIHIDSNYGEGTEVTIKLPLTLAIIDGMTMRVGDSVYTIPTLSIRESFRATDHAVIHDPDGNEMLMIRGACYPVLRINQLYKVPTTVTRISDGIMVMIEHESQRLCLFADAISAKQQVVVKSLPSLIRRARGISGCTLLGDGSISLILDVPGLFRIA